MSDLEVVNDAKNKAIIRAEIAEKRIAELEKRLNFARGEFLREHKEVENLLKENAELKEQISLMNEQEARDIRTRFPC